MNLLSCSSSSSSSTSSLSLAIAASALLASSIAGSACGGTVNVGSFDGDSGASPAGDAGARVDAAPSDGGHSDIPVTTDAGPKGASVVIRLAASAKPVVRTDSFAAQQPKDERIYIRGLTLGTSANDPNPLVVFDLGSGFVEASLKDGDSTVVATVPAKSLQLGTYTYARVIVSHVRYSVDATIHTMGLVVAGQFENVQVLSDNTMVDGQVRASGYFRYGFGVGGTEYASQDGTGAPLPESTGTGGIALEIKDGQAAYVFPTNVPVDPNVNVDVNVTFDVNTYMDFRWQDDPKAGYQANVFDVEPPSFEAVKTFGANSFSVRIAGAGTGP